MSAFDEAMRIARIRLSDETYQCNFWDVFSDQTSQITRKIRSQKGVFEFSEQRELSLGDVLYIYSVLKILLAKIN